MEAIYGFKKCFILWNSDIHTLTLYISIRINIVVEDDETPLFIINFKMREYHPSSSLLLFFFFFVNPQKIPLSCSSTGNKANDELQRLGVSCQAAETSNRRAKQESCRISLWCHIICPCQLKNCSENRKNKLYITKNIHVYYFLYILSFFSTFFLEIFPFLGHFFTFVVFFVLKFFGILFIILVQNLISAQIFDKKDLNANINWGNTCGNLILYTGNDHSPFY